MLMEQLELFPYEIPLCNFCHSEKVTRAAETTWNKELQKWEIKELQFLEHCYGCNSDTELIWTNIL